MTEGAFPGLPRFPVRRVLLGACAASAILSAAALVGGAGTDATRWLFACLFATAVLAFFCTLARDDGAQSAPEQMASFRLGLLQEEVAAYESSHAQLLRKLEATRKERDEAVAARDQAPSGGAAPAGDPDVALRLTAERDAAQSRVLELEKEVVALAARIAAAAKDGVERDAARARVAGLEAEVLAARGRAEAAESAIGRVEAAQREMQRLHAAEIANLRAQTNNRLAAPAPENRLATAEIDVLRTRVADAEEAVRTALRELGVDDAGWPATPAGVIRAASPLTLMALGEDVPGWTAAPGEDTLASAIVDLRRRADERQPARGR
jgi:hypothetical protein